MIKEIDKVRSGGLRLPEWSEEDNNQFEVFSWLPNSSDLSRIDVLDRSVRSMETPPPKLQDWTRSAPDILESDPTENFSDPEKIIRRKVRGIS